LLAGNGDTSDALILWFHLKLVDISNWTDDFCFISKSHFAYYNSPYTVIATDEVFKTFGTKANCLTVISIVKRMPTKVQVVSFQFEMNVIKVATVILFLWSLFIPLLVLEMLLLLPLLLVMKHLIYY
jgi:hypothetical protein